MGLDNPCLGCERKKAYEEYINFKEKDITTHSDNCGCRLCTLERVDKMIAVQKKHNEERRAKNGQQIR